MITISISLDNRKKNSDYVKRLFAVFKLHSQNRSEIAYKIVVKVCMLRMQNHDQITHVKRILNM